jgi:hypothetical protein
MVGHQTESVDRDIVLFLEFPQRSYISLVVGSLGEGHLAVVAALDDMMWVMR